MNEKDNLSWLIAFLLAFALINCKSGRIGLKALFNLTQ